MNPPVKVCGLTRREDVALAAELGAAYFGFIGFPRSPRHIPVASAAPLLKPLPPDRRVYVDVAPAAGTVAAARAAGFTRFQIHFDPETDAGRIGDWAGEAGDGELWLAPRLAPGAVFEPALLRHAAAVLIDTYDPERHGGSGRTGDWERFRQLRERHPHQRWVLAGGLDPDNIVRAAATGADILDVNSGVEASPGVKDPDRMRALFDALREAGD